MTNKQLIKLKLPDVSGVYTFVDQKNRPLYIGRATSLKDRLRSYFAIDLMGTRGPRIVDMVTKAKTVSWKTTDSVLEAIILENNMIKKYQPYYNVDDRDDKSSQYVVITDEPWPRVFLARSRDFDQLSKSGKLEYKVKRIFGPYPHGGLIKEALKILRKMFPFKDMKAFDARHESFYRAIGRSPNSNDADSRKKYVKTINYLILFFEGKKDVIRNRVERDMYLYAKSFEFEEANRCKRLMSALDHINDMALIKKQSENTDYIRQNNNKNDSGAFSKGFRIEAYDVAHLSGTNVVGAFTVSIDGEFARSEYRKFKISRQTNDDIRSLKEILDRRLNHSEWQYPDLIVVDGGQAHLTCAENVLKIRRVNIPVVSVTKDVRHKASKIIGHPYLVKQFKKEIIAINAETHRFVISYHRQKRRFRV